MASQVIGEGSYGCVTKPPLKCANKEISYKNKISKWMMTKDAIKEVEEYVLIGKADPKAEFYTGTPLRCTVRETEVAKVFEKCKLMKRSNKNKTMKKIAEETSLLIIGDGGADLEKWVKNKKLTNIDWVNFWREVPRLFRGLEVLRKNDLVHHDLKPQNVVYKMEDNRLNYIDFGLMSSMKSELSKCRGISSCQARPYWNYPTDILFMNRKVFNAVADRSPQQRISTYESYMMLISKNNKDDFVDAFRIMYNYCFPRQSERRKVFKERYWMGFKDLIIQIDAEKYNEFLEKAFNGFDLFGLGMSLLYMTTASENKMNAAFITKMDDLCLRMMTPNVFVRLSIEQAAAEYNKIIASLS